MPKPKGGTTKLTEWLTVFVVVEKHTKMKKGVVMPQKGSMGRYMAKMMMEDAAALNNPKTPTRPTVTLYPTRRPNLSKIAADCYLCLWFAYYCKAL